MGYRLIQDESLPRGLRRIARDEIDSAIDYLGTKAPAKRDFAIHEARKSLKKLRGLIRMLIPELGPVARDEVAALGILGRSLSELRDSAALVEAVDLLSHQTHNTRLPVELADLRRTLEKHGRDTLERTDVEIVMEAGIIELRKLRRRVAVWRIEDTFEAIAPGLRRTYQRGRKALKLARMDQSEENLHGLRKRVKDRWYQVRVLEGFWPKAGLSPEKPLRDLQEDLGDNHNLDLLLGHVPEEALKLRELVRKTQQKLRQGALASADVLFERTADEFVAELQTLWGEWRPAPVGAASSKALASRAHSAA